MGIHLDLDDLCYGNPVAKEELESLRRDAERAKELGELADHWMMKHNRLQAKMYEAIKVAQKYGALNVELELRRMLNDPDAKI